MEIRPRQAGRHAPKQLRRAGVGIPGFARGTSSEWVSSKQRVSRRGNEKEETSIFV